MSRWVRRYYGRFTLLYYRSVGWDGCPRWSHNTTWRQV